MCYNLIKKIANPIYYFAFHILKDPSPIYRIGESDINYHKYSQLKGHAYLDARKSATISKMIFGDNNFNIYSNYETKLKF